MYPTFTLFGRELGMYGLFSVIGLIFAGTLAVYLAKKHFGIPIEDVLLTFIAAGAAGYLGAHILFGITNIHNIIEAGKMINQTGLWEFIKTFFVYLSGMVFYGGFIGALIGIYVFASKYKYLKGQEKNLIDLYAVVFPLFHTFGRIGCFFGGCCYGVESHFGFRTDTNTLNPSINGVTRLPIQLIEASCNLIIFFIMLYLFKKGLFKNLLIYIYMIIYGTVRFIDEFFRGDTYRGFIFGISTSQFISILLIIFSIVMLLLEHSKKSREKTENIDFSL